MRHRIIYILALLFASLQTFAQEYVYDKGNRLKKVVYENGITVTYEYDALGNRTSKIVSGSDAVTYTISTSVTPAGSGTVTGGGKYINGATVELNAIANAGYQFSKWGDGETTNPRTITVSGNSSFTALFIESQTTMLGDLTGDGKININDLNSLVNAYVSNTPNTAVTDIDNDNQLSILDITSLISMIYAGSTNFDSNGHLFVDLGLPSGTLWATCNVGASAPEEIGDHFAWGEIETKSSYSWATYKWCDGDVCNSSNQNLTKYCDRGGYGMIDGKVSLELEDDVAHVQWGGDWHIPSSTEFQELMDNCTTEWIKLSDGLHAYKFTGPNGKSIIMPAAGYKKKENYTADVFYYWLSDLFNTACTNASAMNKESNTQACISGNLRYEGCAIRPVLSAYNPIVHEIHAPTSYNGIDIVDLGLPSGTLWSTSNLGATSPESYGCYYSWGETSGSCDGKTSFGIENYPVDKTSTLEQGDVLELKDDAANHKMGGAWRMPTLRECQELINTKYTKCEWTKLNGINGYRITSIVKGFENASIFFPAAGRYESDGLKNAGDKGFYFTSTLYSTPDVGNNVGEVYFNSTQISYGGEFPHYGLPIRPVVSWDAIK